MSYTPEIGMRGTSHLRGIGPKVEKGLIVKKVMNVDKLIDVVERLIKKNEGDFASAFDEYHLIIRNISPKHPNTYIEDSWLDIIGLWEERKDYVPLPFVETFLDITMDKLPGCGEAGVKAFAHYGITKALELFYIFKTNCGGDFSDQKKEETLDGFRKQIRAINPNTKLTGLEKIFISIWNSILYEDKLNKRKINTDEEEPSADEDPSNFSVHMVVAPQEVAHSEIETAGNNNDRSTALKGMLVRTGVSINIRRHPQNLAISPVRLAVVYVVYSTACYLWKAMGLLHNELVAAKKEIAELKEKIRIKESIDLRQAFLDSMECPICLRSNQEKNIECQLSCWHILHRDCHLEFLRIHWNKYDGKPFQCPKCREKKVVAFPKSIPFN